MFVVLTGLVSSFMCVGTYLQISCFYVIMLYNDVFFSVVLENFIVLFVFVT